MGYCYNPSSESVLSPLIDPFDIFGLGRRYHLSHSQIRTFFSRRSSLSLFTLNDLVSFTLCCRTGASHRERHHKQQAKFCESHSHRWASFIILTSTSPRRSVRMKLVDAKVSFILSGETNLSPGTGNVSWLTLTAYSPHSEDHLL
ncbi:MAG: hypothetical protein BWX66_01960 [Deltaproteobacteria bacterium ADurb.Bin058]|nr:MAG: hypothetical protein BWX66_01960 [Deltaproteobacteria bacterium ADurb.Bin058]